MTQDKISSERNELTEEINEIVSNYMNLIILVSGKTNKSEFIEEVIFQQEFLTNIHSNFDKMSSEELIQLHGSLNIKQTGKQAFNNERNELKRAAPEDFDNYQQDLNQKARHIPPSNLDPKTALNTVDQNVNDPASAVA